MQISLLLETVLTILELFPSWEDYKEIRYIITLYHNLSKFALDLKHTAFISHRFMHMLSPDTVCFEQKVQDF